MTTFIIEYETKRRTTHTFVTTQYGRDLQGALDNFINRRGDIVPKRIARESGTWHQVEYVPAPQWRVVQ